MTDAPKTNADLLDAYVASAVESALKFAMDNPGSYNDHGHLDPQRDAVMARMVEPSDLAIIEDANPLALAKLQEAMAKEAVLRERIATFTTPCAPKRVTRILCVDEVDEWPPGFMLPTKQVRENG